VCPTLPGFGFSGKPAEPGWDLSRIADTWDQLMNRLDCPRYGAQGGDWGARVTIELARRVPRVPLGTTGLIVAAKVSPARRSSRTWPPYRRITWTSMMLA
jgi:pimeloyl-ACP methyl ester carboxylesterase